MAILIPQLSLGFKCNCWDDAIASVILVLKGMKHNIRRYLSSPPYVCCWYFTEYSRIRFCVWSYYVLSRYVQSADRLVADIFFVADTFCSRYILSLIRFVPDTFCRWYVLSPVHFVADMFCCQFILFLCQYVLSICSFFDKCALTFEPPNVERSSFYFILKIWPASIWRRKIKVYLINFSLSCSCSKVELFNSIF